MTQSRDIKAIREAVSNRILADDFEGALSTLDTGREHNSSPHILSEWLVARAVCLILLLRGAEAVEHLLQSQDGLGVTQAAWAIVKQIASLRSADDVRPLREAVERFAQGQRSWAKTIYPTLFAAMERRLFQDRVGTLRTPYDYSITSYSLWQDGLRELAAGQYDSAVAHLLQSIARYEVGGMTGDVLWSHYDSVVGYLLLDSLETAESHFAEYLEPALPNHFARMAQQMVRAYKEENPRIVASVAKEMSIQWAGQYRDTWYPQIYDRFVAHIECRGSTAQQGNTQAGSSGKTLDQNNGISPGGERGTIQGKKPTQRSRNDSRHEEDPRSFLISRPARMERGEIEVLKKIAEQVNLGNTRPEKIKRHIEFSLSTLRGSLGWDQGMVFLVTEFHDPARSQAQIVGSCKIQYMVDGCWRQRMRVTGASKNWQSAFPVLEFDAAKLNAVELAGNVILHDYNGRGWNWFHAQARFLYALQHGIGGFKYIVANLLTTDEGGKYPFFENVVRQLIAGSRPTGDRQFRRGGVIDYDEADNIRYSNKDFFIQLLGETDRHASVQFPVCVLPGHLKDHIGEIRTRTRGALRVLEAYGFRNTKEVMTDGCSRFDLLDAGSYYGIPFAELKRECKNRYFRTLVVRGVERGLEGRPWLAFSPSKKRAEHFTAAKCAAAIDSDELYVPKGVMSRLSLRDGDTANVLLQPVSRSNRVDKGSVKGPREKRSDRMSTTD